MCEDCQDIEIKIEHDLDSDYEVWDVIQKSFHEPSDYNEIGDYISKGVAWKGYESKKYDKNRRSHFVKKFPESMQTVLNRLFADSDRLWKNAQKRIRDEFEPKEVKKAVPSRHKQIGSEEFWLPYTPEKIQKLKEIIEQTLEAFLYNNFKTEPITHKLRKLKKLGLIQDPKHVTDAISDTYVLSRAIDAMDRGVDFKHAMDIASMRPLSGIDKKSIEWAKQKAASHMRGLANDAIGDLEVMIGRIAKSDLDHHIMMQAAKETVEDARKAEIRSQAVAAKEAGLDHRAFASQLKHYWGDYARDWDRVAFTEMGYIEQQGRAHEYLERYGPQVKVMKVPNPDACPICNKLFLDASGKPRVFTLGELMEYGSNGDKWQNPETGEFENKKASKIRYNRKSQKFDGSKGGMLPTIGPAHPWCRCTLMRFIELLKFEVPKYKITHPEGKKFIEGLRDRVRRGIKRKVTKAFVR